MYFTSNWILPLNHPLQINLNSYHYPTIKISPKKRAAHHKKEQNKLKNKSLMEKFNDDYYNSFRKIIIIKIQKPTQKPLNK